MPDVATAPESGSFTPATNDKARAGSITIIRPDRGATRGWVPATPAGSASEEKTPSPPRVEKSSTNAAAASAPARAEAESPIFSQFGLWLTTVTEGLVEKGMRRFYALLLLFAASILVLRKAVWGRSKRAAKPPRRFP
jgi:hypothetical protein